MASLFPIVLMAWAVAATEAGPPIRPPAPGPLIQPREGFQLQLPNSAVCRVDPAIAGVTLSRTRGSRSVRMTIEIVNRGAAGNWVSGREQQTVTHVVNNGPGTRPINGGFRLLGEHAAGARMILYSTPAYPVTFTSATSGGYVETTIGYEPDILLDGNPCNDDADASNNRLRIEAAAVLDFLNGPDLRRTFTP